MFSLAPIWRLTCINNAKPTCFGAPQERLRPKNLPTPASIVALAAGEDHLLALTNQHEVYALGQNQYGLPSLWAVHPYLASFVVVCGDRSARPRSGEIQRLSTCERLWERRACSDRGGCLELVHHHGGREGDGGWVWLQSEGGGRLKGRRRREGNWKEEEG